MPFQDASELRAVIAVTEPPRFVSRYIFEPIPHVFGTDLDLWISWKSELAQYLEVDPYEIVLTGSGALGFSLNPSKPFTAFHDGSDIDVGVVSVHHFDVAWRYLRQSRPSWLSLPKKIRRSVAAHREHYVFLGTIATDFILPILPFAIPWQAALEQMGRRVPTERRDVKLRIYRDYDALRVYTARSVERLRSELLDTYAAQEPIPIEEA